MAFVYAVDSLLSQLPATAQEVGSKSKRVSYTFPLPSIGVNLGLNLVLRVQSWVQSLAAPGLSAPGNPGGVRPAAHACRSPSRPWWPVGQRGALWASVGPLLLRDSR